MLISINQKLKSIVKLQLIEDRSQIVPNRLFRNKQSFSDRFVPSPFADQADDLSLARRKTGDLIHFGIDFAASRLKLRHSAGDRRAIQPRFPVVDFSNGLE